MKILLFGGSGRVGSRVLEEALSRGHEVTAVDFHLLETGQFALEEDFDRIARLMSRFLESKVRP